MSPKPTKILTESQWFDTYYPPQWGPWRQYYNLGAFREEMDLTGCCSMDYSFHGPLERKGPDRKGHWHVTPRLKGDHRTLANWFICVGDDYWLQSYYQPKTNDRWVRLHAESFQGSWNVTLCGHDDAGMSAHFKTRWEADALVKQILALSVQTDFPQIIEKSNLLTHW